MTQNQLTLLMLLYDHGVSHTKIAAMLEMSIPTVKRACNRIEPERKTRPRIYDWAHAKLHARDSKFDVRRASPRFLRKFVDMYKFCFAQLSFS